MNYKNTLHDNNHLRYSVVDLLSTDGRIGRQAYFVYSTVLPFAFFSIISTMAGLTIKLGSIATSISYSLLTLATLAMILFVVRLTIQRCHDFNASGLFSLFAIIPFVNLIFAMIPGNSGLNSFGEAPEPPSNIIKVGAKLLAIILLAIEVLFILRSLGINLSNFL